MKKFKYRFKIIWQDKYMNKASEFMKKCDLDVGEVGIVETFTFSCEKDIAITELKEKLKFALESCDMNVLHIEGGKIE